MSSGCGDNLTVHDTLVFILFEMDGKGDTAQGIVYYSL